MKRLLLPFLWIALFGAQFLHAQDLHIYINVFTDSIYYLQNGKPVDRPSVRQGANVVLHVENYNNYLYQVQIKNQNNSATLSSGSPLNAIGNVLGKEEINPLNLIFGSGSPLGGIPGIAGLPMSSGFGISAAEREREQRVEFVKKQVSLFDKALQLLEAREEEIASLQAEMQTYFVTQQTQSFVAGELQSIRFNPQLEPRRIKALSQEYASYLFGVADPRQITLEKVLTKTEAKAGFSQLKQNYETRVSQFAEQVGIAENVFTLLNDPLYNFPESNLDRIRKDGEKNIKGARQNLLTYEENFKALEARSSNIRSSDFKDLAELRSTYLALMDNTFSKTYRQPAAAGEQMELQVTLVPLDSVHVTGLATQSLAPIEINVYGGLRINAGFGLGFGQFFRTPQSFFVRDSIIQSSKKDDFAPYLTSFIHFYSPSRNAATLGGSFGIGIPLGGSGGASLESITFFLGPSLILGRSQRIVLSTGLMGGRVSQLSNGYKVGDRFEVQSDLLRTESVYKLGYSAGISFNLAGK